MERLHLQSHADDSARVDAGAVWADYLGLTALTLSRHHETDCAIAVLVGVPIIAFTRPGAASS